MSDNDPYLIIAADSHAGLPTEQYREYLREEVPPAVRRVPRRARRGARGGRPSSACATRSTPRSGSRSTTKSSPAAGTRSSATRRSTATAWRPRSSTPTPTRSRAARACRSAPVSACPATSIPVLGMAGAKAHNRWLAELCSHSPERRCGVALVPITGADRRRARRDPPREGLRPRRGDDPGDVVQPAAVPRPPLRPGVGAVRGARRCRW